MIKKIFLAAVILMNFSQNSFAQFTINITGNNTAYEGWENDQTRYTVTYSGTVPLFGFFSPSVVNGTVISFNLNPASSDKYVQVRWNCNVTSGTVTVQDFASSTTGSFNVTILSYLNDPNYCMLVSPAKQNLHYPDKPDPITVTNCSANCHPAGTYQYQWQVGDVAIGTFPQVPVSWTDIPFSTTNPATDASYLPPQYYVDCIKAYRRKTTFTGGTRYSEIAVISTFDNLYEGAIGLVSSAIVNGVPQVWTISASGGLCDGFNYTYTWQRSVDNVTWVNIGSGATYPAGVQVPGTCYIRRKVDCGGATVYSNVLHIIVQPLNPGTISGSGTYAFNAIPVVTQTAASGGACTSPDYVYTWERSVASGAWVTFGTGINYPANAGVIATCQVRRKVHCVYEDAYTAPITLTMLPYTPPNTENLNYVRVNDMVIPGVHSWEQSDALPTGDKLQITSYLDGFGRTIQTVIKQGSLKQSSLGNLDPDNINSYQDLVSHVQYDGLGRADKGFLPYATTTNLGFYKTNASAEQQTFINTKYGEPVSSIYTYAQTIYDGSPLNRVINQKLPGYYWNNDPAYKGISHEYDLYKVSVDHVVINWDFNYTTGLPEVAPTAYADKSLIKTITKDEKDKQIIEFKDMSGNTVLKKVQEANSVAANSYNGWLNTYYVYDDYGRLRYTITPKAVATMAASGNWVIDVNIKKGLCFYQEYDNRGRPVVTHSPDGGEIWLVYDKRDRLVFSQDENQRNRANGTPAKPNQWSFSVYDDNDRVVATGLVDDARSRASMQSYVDGLAMQNRQISVYTGSTETVTAYAPVVGNFTGSPFPSFYTNSLNYYDDYVAANGLAYNPITAGDFAPTTNQYAIQPVKSSRTKGMTTVSRVRILDENYDDGQTANDKFLSSTSYIDEFGRVIQMQTENILGGTDVTSVQYDFSGKVLCTKSIHKAPGNVFNDLLVITRNDYDLMGNSKKFWKLYTKTVSDVQNLSKYKKLNEFSLDEFGRAKTKWIGEDPANPGNPLEIQDITYNIQGNLTGINKNYALGGSGASQWSRRFGLYLGYENADGKFTASQWNGNLTGVIWRSQGDNATRKYNYEYDNVNRFTAARFMQKDVPTAGDNTYSNSKVDLSAFVNQYDPNGNIMAMQQTGIKPGTNGGILIDDLTYQYYDKSNRLKAISDQAFGGSNIQNGKQGDFMNFTPSTGLDYTYDHNGNLATDNNKNIIAGTGGAGIVSNFLDLPHQVTISGKSKTEYTYDAAGNKLAKKVTRLTTGAPPPTTTFYVGGFVYETAATTGQPKELQYILHEEGKLRIMQPVDAWDGPSGQVNYLNTKGNIEIANTGSTGNPNKWGVWDYFIKDNLSNTRLVLTEEYHEQQMLCSMELTPQVRKDEEEATFGNATNNEVANTRFATTSLPWQPSAQVSKLIFVSPGVTPATTIGPNAILKVMAGDELFGTAKYYYQNTVASNNDNGAIISNIANSLSGFLQSNPGVNGGVKDNISSTFLSSSGGPLQPFLSGNNPNPAASTTPKAFINYIFFDEQFRYVPENSGAVPVPALGTGQTSSSGDMPPMYSKVVKNGYVYVYLSNESSNVPVYFDDFRVTHRRGPIVEDNAYYPFGLKIQGISARAAKKARTKQGYQGDYNEQDEETGYNEFTLRSYDPQIGRWIQVDPFVVQPGMYNGMGNDPVNIVDPLGGFNWYQNNETQEIRWFDGDGEVAGYTNRGVDFHAQTDILGVTAYYGFSAAEEWQYKNIPEVTVRATVSASEKFSANVQEIFDKSQEGNSRFDSDYDLKRFSYDSDDHIGWKATTFAANVFVSIFNSAKYSLTTRPDQQIVDISKATWKAGAYIFTTSPLEKGVDLWNAAQKPQTYENIVATGTMVLAAKSSVSSSKVMAAEMAPSGVNRIYSARELVRRTAEPGPFHNFPESFNQTIFSQGTKTVTPNFFKVAKKNLSNTNIMYKLPGTINGTNGTFEIGVRLSTSGNTELIMHRFFKPN